METEGPVIQDAAIRHQAPIAVPPALPNVSIVVIGRNEAKHLPACIQSIREIDYPLDRVEILYIDTDSSDGSPEVARSLGVRVCEEHSDFPTPGRARNRGWREATHAVIHFMDGDMTIAPEYLKKAVPLLGKEQVACVFGIIDERHKQHNLFSRTMHYNWEVKVPGEVDSPGAGGTFLSKALVEVRGYNADLLQSEETEIGFRLREKGYRILLINELMGIHDYDVRTLGSFLWRFYKGTGSHLGRMLWLPPSPSLAPMQRSARRNLIQCIGALAAVFILHLLGWWSVLLLAILALPVYITIKYWSPAELRRQRIAYFLLTYAVKPIIWAGMIDFWLQQRSHQTRTQQDMKSV